jgi:ADP-ribose pyrophosphatase
MSNTPEVVVAEGKFVRLVRRGKWEYASRTKVTGIVGIVAVTDDGKLILIEQDRPAVGKRCIEIPAGLAGDEDGMETEELAEAAKRELLEETGYAAAKMEYLAEGPPSAGITDEIITLFRASGLTRQGVAGGVGGEEITLHEVPLAGVPAWLKARAKDGLAVDLKVYAGLYFVRER